MITRTEAGPRPMTAWLVTMTLLVVVTGMAYTLWWPAVVRHHAFYWVDPGDIWSTVRAAHWVGWGGFSFVYSSQTGLVTLPGVDVLFTPMVLVSSALGLSETAPGLPPQAKPTAWLLVGPLTMACSAVALFAFDSLARQLGVSRSRRRALAFLESAILWEVLVIWGHPEDVLALGLAVFALVQMQKGHWRTTGWLLGAAIGMQLYVVALVPLFCFAAGARKTPALLARAAVIPGFLFIAVFVPNPHATLHALFNQPNYPRIDHPTPWVLLAPKLADAAVAAGPGRLIGLATATGIGALAARHRRDLLWMTWLAAAALAARCVFESVMDPYYLVPVMAVTVAAAATLPLPTWAAVSAAIAGLMYFSSQRMGMWDYWIGMTALVVVALTLTLPRRTGRSGSAPTTAQAPDRPGQPDRPPSVAAFTN
jgi:hypothetical protein